MVEEVVIKQKKEIIKLKKEIIKLKKLKNILVKLKREIIKKGLTVVQLVKVLGDNYTIRVAIKPYPNNSCKLFSNSVSSLYLFRLWLEAHT